MQKSLRSIVCLSVLGLSTLSLSAEPGGTNPRPPRGSGNANVVVVVLTTAAALLGL